MSERGQRNEPFTSALGDGTLMAYALGALDPDDIADVELALATDEAFRGRLADYQVVATALALSAPPLAAPAGGFARILACIALGRYRAASGVETSGADVRVADVKQSR